MKSSRPPRGEGPDGSSSAATPRAQPSDPERRVVVAGGAGAADDAGAMAPTVDGGPPHSDPGPQSFAEQLPFPSWERYRIVAFLGAGGMGAVYKARDPRLNRSVAIKLLRGSQGDPFTTRQRRHFEREARAQACIEHPHICKIYEVGEVEGQPYIAMQLIHGSSLGGLQSAMSREDKVRVIQRVADALQSAHAQNLIHRDIKPGNILIERRPDGAWWPYLMDFGLAREVDSNTQSSTGGIEGTLAFMPPEQARGENRSLDLRADIYALGATLYSVLAGRPPFIGDSMQVLLAILMSEPPRLRTFDPGIPPALETIVHKCLEKDPARRYGSARALAEDLGRFLAGQQIAARPPGLLRRAIRSAQRHKLLVASAAAALVASLVLGSIALRIRWQAAQQERLMQHLGPEVAKMEWLLRSARQLPLHDLAREKDIVRARMKRLQAELLRYGERSRGLAFYALGRGHMALHEYAQALAQLRQAEALGVQTPELHYALGFALGKHFEQAMQEARLSGGGDWASKQLKELEPTYLSPALASLERSRAARLEAPQYLEGLIAYYRRDYETAIRKADEAIKEAPWLYEAHKLAGDVFLERALHARDTGRSDEAERHFASSVKRYGEAALIGQSDGEVYEALADAWIGQIEMAQNQARPSDAAYAAAVAASEKLSSTEPGSVAGPLKLARAAMVTVMVSGVSPIGSTRIRQCITSAEAVLTQQPEHPHARELAASCYTRLADLERARGKDPMPLFGKAADLLEPAVQRNPRFLWGLNSLSNVYGMRGIYLQQRGSAAAAGALEKAVKSSEAAAALDASDLAAVTNVIFALSLLIKEVSTDEDVERLLSRADAWLARCQAINPKFQQCYDNHFQGYVIAAQRALLSSRDPGRFLKRAFDGLAETRRLGEGLLDAEQHAALAHWVEATDRVRQQKDPGDALSALQDDLRRCAAIAPEDAMCRTVAAQAEWVTADWLLAQGRPAAARLQDALAKALLATSSPEPFAEAWYVLAATHLRLARLAQDKPAVREAHLAQGLSAIERLLVSSPNHALGLATQGALYLVRAQAERTPALRQAAARSAVERLQAALARSPFLSASYQPLLQSARALVSP